ncbi:18050_t:CDS:2 [Funneliformis geosporum]|nr:18050_t:CDS:2 [Funneliformis geosporum]
MDSSELTAKIINYLEDKNSKGSWLLTEYKKINQIRQEYQSLISEIDKKEQKSLLAEIKKLTAQAEELILQIKEQIITEKVTEQEVIMEIRPGPGGDEAGLFAGIHRVQREPETGKRGKVHTSTASVVILPPPQDIELDLLSQNLKIETCRASGAGGQHVNTTDSAIKATYTYSVNGKTETITAISQDNRAIGNLRSAAIGTAERSEKIRTYKFRDNLVTDHRLKISWKRLDSILEGDLEEIIQKLIDYEVEKKITRKGYYVSEVYFGDQLLNEALSDALEDKKSSDPNDSGYDSDSETEQAEQKKLDEIKHKLKEAGEKIRGSNEPTPDNPDKPVASKTETKKTIDQLEKEVTELQGEDGKGVSSLVVDELKDQITILKKQLEEIKKSLKEILENAKSYTENLFN